MDPDYTKNIIVRVERGRHSFRDPQERRLLVPRIELWWLSYPLLKMPSEETPNGDYRPKSKYCFLAPR